MSPKYFLTVMNHVRRERMPVFSSVADLYVANKLISHIAKNFLKCANVLINYLLLILYMVSYLLSIYSSDSRDTSRQAYTRPLSPFKFRALAPSFRGRLVAGQSGKELQYRRRRPTEKQACPVQSCQHKLTQRLSQVFKYLIKLLRRQRK